jgi:flagellar motor switch protein FliG
MPHAPASLREVAILVASVDDALALRLLADLPPAQAAAVQAQMAALDDVDPDEQLRILEAFRASRAQAAPAALGARSDDGVEAVFSAASAFAAEEPRGTARPGREAPLARSLAGIDAVAVARLLQAQHPQVIAAALSRMDEDQAAAVFAALPDDLQHEVLPRVANQQPADEEAVAALEAQLVHWTNVQLQQQRSRAAGEQLVRRLLARTPAERRAALAPVAAAPLTAAATRLERTAAALAESAVETDDAPLAQRQSPRWGLWRLRRVAARRASADESAAPTGSAPGEPAASTATPPVAVEVPAPPAVPLDDCSAELEQLDDRRLLQALKQADPWTVRLALASSSETFLRRIERKLPRREATRLRENLFAIGPAKLSDLRRAQHDFLALARR